MPRVHARHRPRCGGLRHDRGPATLLRLTSGDGHQVPGQQAVVVAHGVQGSQLRQCLLVSRRLVCRHRHVKLQELQGSQRHLAQQPGVSQRAGGVQGPAKVPQRQRLLAARREALLAGHAGARLGAAPGRRQPPLAAVGAPACAVLCQVGVRGQQLVVQRTVGQVPGQHAAAQREGRGARRPRLVAHQLQAGALHRGGHVAVDVHCACKQPGGGRGSSHKVVPSWACILPSFHSFSLASRAAVSQRRQTGRQASRLYQKHKLRRPAPTPHLRWPQQRRCRRQRCPTPPLPARPQSRAAPSARPAQRRTAGRCPLCPGTAPCSGSRSGRVQSLESINMAGSGMGTVDLSN